MAGPLLRLSIRNWMPVTSMFSPMRPPSASTSRTIWPFATPPMAGLQLMAAMVSRFAVSRSVFAPSRAEAAAASTPACPPPITRTSYFISDSVACFFTEPVSFTELVFRSTFYSALQRRLRQAARRRLVCQSAIPSVCSFLHPPRAAIVLQIGFFTRCAGPVKKGASAPKKRKSGKFPQGGLKETPFWCKLVETPEVKQGKQLGTYRPNPSRRF